MAITKQSIIEGAYQDIGFDGNLESTRLSQGLRTLDRMMAAWLQGGLDIGYLVAESSALTDDSGLLLQHIGAVQMNLAVNLARALAIPADLGYAGMARQAYRDLLPTNTTLPRCSVLHCAPRSPTLTVADLFHWYGVVADVV